MLQGDLKRRRVSLCHFFLVWERRSLINLKTEFLPDCCSSCSRNFLIKRPNLLFCSRSKEVTCSAVNSAVLVYDSTAID